MDAAPAAIPPKPNTAAINAIIKNVIVQRNIISKFYGYSMFETIKIPKLIDLCYKSQIKAIKVVCFLSFFYVDLENDVFFLQE